MEKVCPWCGQLWDRGRLQNRTEQNMLCVSVGYKCSPCEVAEPVVVMFGTWTCVRPRNHVLRVGAHWRHLANAIEWQFGLVMGRVLEPQLINC